MSHNVNFQISPKPHLWLGGVIPEQINGNAAVYLCEYRRPRNRRKPKKRRKTKEIHKNDRISGMIACEKVWIT